MGALNMSLKFEARREIPRWLVYGTPLLAIALTILSGYLLFMILGLNPGSTLYIFLVSPLETQFGLAELAVKGGPLILIATGLAIGFRANVWNIGAEGQLTIGAIFGAGVALAFWGDEGFWILPLMFVAGALGGMLWAAIPAFLKTKFEVSEILTSLMLTYVATLVLSILVHGPWRDPEGFNFPQSRLFTEAAILPVILEGTRLHVGALVALFAAAAAWVLLSYTVTGFQIKVVGQAPMAARFAGFSQKRTLWFTLLLAGALAGIAGMIEVAGPIGQLTPQLTPGYGFTAIIVAFLGRLNPIGIVLAGLVMAISYIGGENAQVYAQLPQAATGVFQGMLLFYLLASDFLVRYRVRIQSAKPRREVATA
jgi:general nucleoside transport system permease protein